MEADDINIIINNNNTGNNGSGKPKRKPTTPIDPLSVTESLGFQTFRRESRRPWTKEEDDQLTKIMIELHPGANEGTASMLSGDEVKWDVVALFFAETSQRKAKDCRKRWCNSLDPNLRKGKWTPEEDTQLLSAFQKYGAAWKKVASTILGRTDDQCAKRYIEVLDPKTKDRLKPWTHEEDLLLIRRVKIHGTKWKTIADDIEGRPSLTCRNRWRKIVTDVVRGKASAAVKEEVDMITNGENGNKLEELNEIKYEDIVKYDIAGGSEDVHNNSKNESQPLYMPQTSTNQNRNQLSIQLNQQQLQLHLLQQQGQTQSNYSQQKARTYDSMQASLPKLVKKPVQSEIEWKYTMTNPGQPRTAPGAGSNSNGEVFHEGLIANQELVQYLIGYAKSNGLNVTVHQHIHHHYLSPTTTTHHHHQNQQQLQNSHSTSSQQQDQLFGSYKQSSQVQHPNQQQQMSKSQQGLYSPLPTINDTSTGFYIEPETQVNRYQHFNYLPPLTEVPKLNSSASSPNSSSKDGQMHHHHHHHHYQLPKPSLQHPISTGSNSKESDLFRLLNGRSQNNSPQPLQRGTSPIPLNPLTPLTQAVELAVEVEENGNKRSHSQRKQEQLKGVEIHRTMQNQQEGKVNQSSPKRHKFEDDDEEGIDFWETMRNLTTRQSSEQKLVTPVAQETKTNSNNNNNVNINNNNNSAKTTVVTDRKPVSQHHPLHHLPSGSTPMPAEEDIDLDAYGLFYNVYTREGSAPITNNEQSTFDSLNGFGMIPFNPS